MRDLVMVWGKHVRS